MTIIGGVVCFFTLTYVLAGTHKSPLFKTRGRACVNS